MKRNVLSILLIWALIIVLTGCSTKSNNSTDNLKKAGWLDLEVEDISSFNDGLARVKIGGKYGFINKNGKKVIDNKYESTSNFSDGLALVMTDEESFEFIDYDGKIVIGGKIKYS